MESCTADERVMPGRAVSRSTTARTGLAFFEINDPNRDRTHVRPGMLLTYWGTRGQRPKKRVIATPT